VAKRHEQSPPVGQDFFGVQVGVLTTAPPAARAYAKVPLAIWSFPGIGGDVDVAGLQMFQEFGQAEILVDETHVAPTPSVSAISTRLSR
jgi:hypothetical protein